MAHDCTNFITNASDEVLAYFESKVIEEKNIIDPELYGVMFINEPICSIELDREQRTIQFFSKWSCPKEDFRILGMNIVVEFSENGSDYFGYFIIDNDKVIEVYADEDELNKIIELSEGYEYNGEYYESKDDIIEKILTKQLNLIGYGN